MENVWPHLLRQVQEAMGTPSQGDTGGFEESHTEEDTPEASIVNTQEKIKPELFNNCILYNHALEGGQ